MEKLYQLLKRKKLTFPEKIFKFCETRPLKEVLETCMEALVITSSGVNKSTTVSLFNFSASFTLSGARYPCESIYCRLNRLADLAKFSAIYADSTTIYNPFDFVYFFLNSNGRNLQPSDEKLRLEALNALLITFEFKPLIERGLINFSKTIYVVCANCKKKRDEILISIYNDLDKVAEKTLFPLIKREVEIEYEKKSFHLKGIESLIGEDLYMHYKKFPSFLIKNGKKIKNLKKIKYSHPLIQKIADEAIESLIFQKMGDLENLTQTYLTDNMLEKTLLENLGKQAENRAFNFFAKNLPIIQNASYENIIRMRDTYSDEFSSFQTFVSELIDKAHTFETQKEFNVYVNNKLESKLGDLKKIQKESKRKFVVKGFASGAILGASVVIPVLSNFDLPSLVTLAAACYQCNDIVSEVSEIEKKIQRSPLFFYYKLERSFSRSGGT